VCFRPPEDHSPLKYGAILAVAPDGCRRTPVDVPCHFGPILQDGSSFRGAW